MSGPNQGRVTKQLDRKISLHALHVTTLSLYREDKESLA
jgi:hypothetical protein